MGDIILAVSIELFVITMFAKTACSFDYWITHNATHIFSGRWSTFSQSSANTWLTLGFQEVNKRSQHPAKRVERMEFVNENKINLLVQTFIGMLFCR